jgi:hypothetical protein
MAPKMGKKKSVKWRKTVESSLKLPKTAQDFVILKTKKYPQILLFVLMYVEGCYSPPLKSTYDSGQTEIPVAIQIMSFRRPQKNKESSESLRACDRLMSATAASSSSLAHRGCPMQTKSSNLPGVLGMSDWSIVDSKQTCHQLKYDPSSWQPCFQTDADGAVSWCRGISNNLAAGGGRASAFLAAAATTVLLA